MYYTNWSTDRMCSFGSFYSKWNPHKCSHDKACQPLDLLENSSKLAQVM